MIHDFLLFLYFTASLNFQSKARQLIVEPIRQTVVRIVLWFEEIYMFNSMSNILYKQSILEHKSNTLYNIITYLYFVIPPNISWAWSYLGETWQKKIINLDFFHSLNWVGGRGGVSVLGYATKNCFERATENTGATEIASGRKNVNQRRSQFPTAR